MVTFQGYMRCSGASTLEGTTHSAFIEFASQIVAGADEEPIFGDGPGALLHTWNVSNSSHGFQLNVSFNLASTRVFAIPGAGLRRYRFKMTRFLQPTHQLLWRFLRLAFPTRLKLLNPPCDALHVAGIASDN